ncbi:unnamed protein product [Mytilus edulis]|uniref:Uncharacterized protein n=1 Tax=Mytilus edulis TaxID=6550 RepID=A0A8S3S7D1_MYTED|nr:unnamed protein product [Mytilus edulis]
MQTITNNAEPTRRGNLQPQQIVHVNTFKNLGTLQIVVGGILAFLTVVDLIGVGAMFVYLLPTLICSGWFVMTGCLPICMSENTESSLKFRLYTYNLKGWFILSFAISALSVPAIIVAIVSASYCCCCWGTQSQQMFPGVSPSQPAPTNQIQAANMLSLINTTGKTVPDSEAQQYNSVGGTDQEFGYPQNPNVSNSYPPTYINA